MINPMPENASTFSRLYHHLEAGVFVFDRHKTIIYCNTKACEYVSRTPEELLGRSALDPAWAFIHEDHTPMSADESPVTLVLAAARPVEPFTLGLPATVHHPELWVRVSGFPLFDDNGEVEHVVVSFTDLTSRKITEEALRASELWYRDLVENINDVFYITDEKGILTYISPRVEEVSGYSVAECLGAHVSAFVHDEDIPLQVKQFEKLAAGMVEPAEYRIRDKSGGIKWARISSRSIFENDVLVGVRGIITDITEQKMTTQALAESERKYRLLAENAADTIWTMTMDGTFTYISPSIMALRGYTPEEAMAIPMDKTMTRETLEHIRAMFSAEYMMPPGERWKSRIEELEMIRKDGSTVWTEVQVRFILDEQGNPLELQGSTRDIMEKRQSQENLKASLREKEVLIKEIHHRVKNNMQLITSLLHLQSRAIKDSHMLELFRECQNRIKSMALIHEKLYRSKDFSNLDMRDYIQTLATSLARAYRKGTISMSFDIADTVIDRESLIPLGLIVNELVSNALKHGFPDGRKGSITVTLRDSPGGERMLTVSDNGIGFPGGVNPCNASTLGFQLVSELTSQLGGRLEVKQEEGTAFTVIF